MYNILYTLYTYAHILCFLTHIHILLSGIYMYTNIHAYMYLYHTSIYLDQIGETGETGEIGDAGVTDERGGTVEMMRQV